MGDFFGVIFGGLVTIAIAMLVERMRRPRLELTIEQPFDGPWPSSAQVRAMRSLRLKLNNRPLPWWGRWWMSPTPALQCRAAITFHEPVTKQDVFGRSMAGRWANAPEPFVIQPPQGPAAVFVPDPICNVYPGESAILDVAIRADDDTDAYGWNNEAYFSRPLGRNENWRLRPGIHLVRVIVTSSGQEHVQCFRLVNQAPSRDAFHLAANERF
jgi:hypothetical protein